MTRNFPQKNIVFLFFSFLFFPPLFLPNAGAVDVSKEEQDFPWAGGMSKEEQDFLWMYFMDENLVVTSPSREEKPLSLTAENVTVITAEQIEAIHARTLTDILNYVPGVQMDVLGGPGSIAVPHIQGSEARHVRVIIDGITLNNLADNVVDIGGIPVQNIERLEIIRGPASSAWGSSLGGVINIITKSGENSRAIGGTISTSYGEEDTVDSRIEASGKVDRLSYYLNFNKLRSDGLTANTPFDSNNFYSKLKWDIAEKADILFTLGYRDGSRGLGEFPEFDLSIHQDFEFLHSSITLGMGLGQGMEANLSLRTLQQDADHLLELISSGEKIQKNTFRDSNYGGSAQFTWKRGAHHLVVGVDVDEENLKSNLFTDGGHGRKKWAFFANDTITFHRFSFTPGFRFDHTSTNGDFFSPSFGVTYQMFKKTLLRSTISRGFNVPALFYTFGTGTFFLPNPDLDMEKVWSYQVGIETTSLKYLWFKAGLFRHEIRDAISTKFLPDGLSIRVNDARQRRQGLEIEMRTRPLYHASLFAGFTFVEAKDLKTGDILPDVGRIASDIGLEYNDLKSFRAVLKGHYVDWNDYPFDSGRYDSFVWDIYLNKRFYSRGRWSVDAFLSGRNLLNGSQNRLEVFRNPGRWIEGGLKMGF